MAFETCRVIAVCFAMECFSLDIWVICPSSRLRVRWCQCRLSTVPPCLGRVAEAVVEAPVVAVVPQPVHVVRRIAPHRARADVPMGYLLKQPDWTLEPRRKHALPVIQAAQRGSGALVYSSSYGGSARPSVDVGGYVWLWVVRALVPVISSGDAPSLCMTVECLGGGGGKDVLYPGSRCRHAVVSTEI